MTFMTIPSLVCTLVVCWYLLCFQLLSSFNLILIHSSFPQISPGVSCFLLQRIQRESGNILISWEPRELFPFPSVLGLGRFSLRRVRTNLEKQRNRTFVLGIFEHQPSDAYLPFPYPAECSFKKCYFFLTCSHGLLLVLINNIKKICLLLLMEFSALYMCVLQV